MKKLEQLYEGKAKKVFATEDPDVVIVDYKDDATAFNGEKKGTIVGKGVIKELRRLHPQSNIVAIDFDPGASEVNQLNRIKLMLSTAFKSLMIACSLAIFWVPMAWTMVTMELNASGIAATARATANINASSTGSFR